MNDNLDEVYLPTNPIDLILTDFRYKRIRPYLKGDILDVGCGYGSMTRRIEKSFNVDGVDGSPEKARIAQKNCKKSTIYTSRFENFKPLKKYDTCVLSNVLEHSNDSKALLKLCYDWLNNDGVIIATVPNRLALHKLVGNHMGFTELLNPNDEKVGHTRTYILSELHKEVCDAGFKVNDYGGVLLKPLPNNLLKGIPYSVLKGYFKLSNTPQFSELCSVVYVVGIKK